MLRLKLLKWLINLPILHHIKLHHLSTFVLRSTFPQNQQLCLDIHVNFYRFESMN
jgi:hypothetical protein